MLSLVDVGGSGGLHPKWERFIDRLHPILFECNPAEAEKLRLKYSLAPQVTVIEKGLYNEKGARTLNLAKHFGCTSLREPNFGFLANYPIAKQFVILDHAEIECARYDEIHASGLAPAPDVIKIDVQGCEYEVLEGFDDLLRNCLSIELEAHYYPLYVGQRLLGDIVALLSKFDLVLKRTRTIEHFEGDLVEVDAFFGPSRAALARMSAERRRQLAFVEAVLKP
jgi:FkbM family methyltransferase